MTSMTMTMPTTVTTTPIRVPERPRTLRLTRRGRMAVVAGVLALIVGVLWMSGTSTEATGSAPRSRPVTVTVQTGETLWQLASRVAPGVDPRLVVGEIERLNALAGPTVYAGQQLRVPHYS